MLEKCIHQNDNQQKIVNKSHVDNSRYFIIHGKSHPTYILNRFLGSIIIPFGREI